MALFSNDNKEMFQKMGNCAGWTCVLMSGAHLSAVDFAAKILGGN